MPRVHGQSKQKNKPFKGKSRGKNKGNKIASTKTKGISKAKSLKRVKNNKVQLMKEKKMKKMHLIQDLTKKNEYLDTQTKKIITQKMKIQSQMKIVLLLPCNADANASELIKSLYQSIDKELISVKTSQQQNLKAFKSFSSFQMLPGSNKSYLKSKIQFIAPSRDIQQLIDLAKCADIICPILSCKSTNTQGMNLNPYQQGKAFDEVGYTILNMVRTLGVPTTVGIVQHLDLHAEKHHDKITRLFKRFLTSQLGQQQKIITVTKNNDLNKLIRTIDSLNPHLQAWKNQRGYMMVQNIAQSSNGNIILEGYLKGNCVNANQLVHITGFDDYQIQSIQIKQDHPKFKRQLSKSMYNQKENSLIQFATTSQDMYAFAKNNQQTKSKNQNQLLSALQGLKLETQPKSKAEQIQQNNDYEDISDQNQIQQEEEQFLEEQLIGTKEEQKQKRIQMQMRKDDQMEFQDEVQYTADQKLRQKYRDYQGLKSFKTSQWNHYQNLPEQYDKIFTFKHYHKTQNNVLAENTAKGFAYPGFLISITVKGLKEKQKDLDLYLKKHPLIVTFMLKHQRKMTMLHARVKKNPYYPLDNVQVNSNQTYLISMGFRKFYIKPIFSKCISGTEKTKYVKSIKEDYQSNFLCSFYYYNYFPPAPFAIYRVNTLNLNEIQPCPIMYGQLAKCDPLHIILERIILCGYPFKINRRRSTVRYMFFDPKDVKFFKPIQVKTKMGLRGKIQQSLGTHGLMKVMFSDQIKHNDTVCMYLYKRVYPLANF